MERYLFLDHTADAKFEAYGATLEEAFANAALAVASLMWDWERIEKRIRIPVSAEGRDLERLLYTFLGDVIYLLETRTFLLGAVEEMKIEERGGGWKLSAVFAGDDRASAYDVSGDVKAVTYHDMRIERGPDGVRLRAVVDL